MQPIDYAREDLGVWEWKGDEHNPKIIQYFKDVGHTWVKDDETAWCASFVGAMLKKAGIPNTGALNARSYLDWGEPVSVEEAREGDIVVFSRGDPNGWRGHVGFLVGLEKDGVAVLGGNQSNQVNIKDYSLDRLLGIRRHPVQESDVRNQIKKIKCRKSKKQSTTLQATAVAAASGIAATGTAISALNNIAQLIVIICAVIGAASLAWIARERIRKWAAGDR